MGHHIKSFGYSLLFCDIFESNEIGYVPFFTVTITGIFMGYLNCTKAFKKFLGYYHCLYAGKFFLEKYCPIYDKIIILVNSSHKMPLPIRISPMESRGLSYR